MEQKFSVLKRAPSQMQADLLKMDQNSSFNIAYEIIFSILVIARFQMKYQIVSADHKIQLKDSTNRDINTHYKAISFLLPNAIYLYCCAFALENICSGELLLKWFHYFNIQSQKSAKVNTHLFLIIIFFQPLVMFCLKNTLPQPYTCGLN